VKGRLNELWALIGALGAEVKKAVSTGAGGVYVLIIIRSFIDDLYSRATSTSTRHQWRLTSGVVWRRART